MEFNLEPGFFEKAEPQLYHERSTSSSAELHSCRHVGIRAESIITPYQCKLPRINVRIDREVRNFIDITQ